VHPPVDSTGDGTSIHQIVEDLLGERIEALAAWIQELDAHVRATSAAGDEKTLKELRKALEAWSKRDPKFEERLTERVDVLADRLATLSSTVNQSVAARASSEGEIAGLRRELEQEAAKLHAALRELGSTDVSQELQELRRSVADVARGTARGGNGGAGAVTREEIENIAVRVDMLAKTVQTTAAGLAGREGDLASLRRTLEDADARIEQVAASIPRSTDASAVAALDVKVGELARALAEAAAKTAEREQAAAAVRGRVEEQGAKLEALAATVRDSASTLESRLAALAQKDDGAVAELDARVTSLAARLDADDPAHDELRTRLDAVAAELTTLAAERTASAGDVSELRRAIDESGTRFDAALAELQARLEALPTEPSTAEVESRFAPLQAQLDGLAARVVEADTRVTERFERETSRTQRLEQRLDEINESVADVAKRQEASTTAADTAKSAWELERAWVREQMDALVSAVADTASRADVEPLAIDLAKRLEALGNEQAALAAEIESTRESVLAETERLAARLAELPEPSAPGPDLEPAVSDLAARLDALAAEQSNYANEIASTHGALRAEIERVGAEVHELPRAAAPIPPSEDEQLKQLLTAFADRIEAMERQRASIADEAARAATSHVEQVRPLVEGLRRRLDESERRLEALGDTQEMTTKLDELAARQHSLEERPAAPPASATLPGDGRFRVELRALELRMQHAEAAARENREAVLVQLERLASRIEWRLQRLESDEEMETEGTDEEPPLGQVVPLRGGAES
jgi:chromosome segregation ATPase